MATPTEAALLFDTGVLYGKRGMLRPQQGDGIFVGFKPGAFSVYFGDAPIFHCDREGRWQRAFVDGLHYLKGLDGSVRTIDRVREGANMVLHRRTLDAQETRAADERMRATARDLLDALDTGKVHPSEPPPSGKPIGREELRVMLETIARWDEAAWAAHVARYRAAYGPLPFVTPDSSNPVILQGTIGHADGVAFGGGSAEPHVTRTPAEFARHAEAVAALLGRRIEQSNAIFLGSSDVLARPVADIAAFLATAQRVFPIEPPETRRHPDPTGETPHRIDGIHAFLDRFDAPLPHRDNWRHFRESGLTRVGLGVESGAADIRESFSKHWDDHVLRTLVLDLKAAGIGIGVAVLATVGGATDSSRHVEATAALIAGLGLGRGDLVMLLDPREIAEASPAPLSQAEFEAGRDALRAALTTIRAAGVKVVPYSLAKQANA